MNAPGLDPADGVAVEHDGRRVLLKWHKLRRAADDPPFSLANLRAGLACGASLEIDIRLLADGAWVCLHDDVLDEETDGHGRVAGLDSEAIRRLRIAGAGFAPPLLTEVTALVAAAPETGACLQLDLKEPAKTLTEAGVESFVAAIAPVAGRCLLSGVEFDPVARLGSGVPGLRLGYDPYELAEGRDLADRRTMEAFVAEVFAIAPAADAFYLYHRFVGAALALGFNPLKRLKENGAIIDIWTLDPTTPRVIAILEEVIAAGADQITTNDPPGIDRLWADRGKDDSNRV
jgi:glycerophosphoryl diester phosphodiesterase